MAHPVRQFDLARVRRIWGRTLKLHLGLYAGYVAELNKLTGAAGRPSSADPESWARRFAFEYNGVVLHELFFEALSGDATPLDRAGALAREFKRSFGGYAGWRSDIRELATIRGIGWIALVRGHATGRAAQRLDRPAPAGRAGGRRPPADARSLGARVAARLRAEGPRALRLRPDRAAQLVGDRGALRRRAETRAYCARRFPCRLSFARLRPSASASSSSRASCAVAGFGRTRLGFDVRTLQVFLEVSAIAAIRRVIAFTLNVTITIPVLLHHLAPALGIDCAGRGLAPCIAVRLAPRGLGTAGRGLIDVSDDADGRAGPARESPHPPC